MFRRILKMFGALGTGVGVTLVTQFLLPPAFLHYYGVIRYGEWLVLSATIGYLSTLNFGITTYATNQLTILLKRKDMDGYRALQGSTLALLLAVFVLGVAISALVFILPFKAMLHLTVLSLAEARMVAFLLGIQMMVQILGGYYNNFFMVAGSTHRGMVWGNLRRLVGTLICVPLAMMRMPFSTIAFAQFVVVLLVTLLTIYDLKRLIGPLPLGLGGANWKATRASLAPSGLFAMVYTQQFLVFQVPLILLQWIVGPEVVVLFTIGRTVLATARQFLQTITDAVRPEITFAFAERDTQKLLRIFHYSETVVFFTIPVANLGAFLFSPVLLSVWLHKPALFDAYTYGLLALISAAMSMREHKQFFHYSTNTHDRFAMIVFFGNLLMIAVSIPFTMRFGLYGFLYVWMASEMTQMALLYFENKKLFEQDPSINMIPVVKLVLVMLVSLPLCAGLLHMVEHRTLALISLVALMGTLALIVESWFVFGVRAVWDLVRNKMRGGSMRAPVNA